MRQTLRILAFFPLAALAARSLVVLIAVVSAGGESFAEVVADPVAGIVRGTETPGPDYAPPQIGNGELNTTVDWLGGSSHPSPCSRGFFLAARRIIQPKRELFGQGRIETVVETNGRRCAKPVSWEQQLDIRTGVNRNCNVYADDVRLESEMFVPLAENTFCVRQTFVNGGRSACRVRGGIAFAHPTHERMVGGWERQDGRFRHVNRTYGFRIVDSVTDVVAGEAGGDFAATADGVEATRTFALAPGERGAATWFVVFADTLDAAAKEGTPALRADARERTLRAQGFSRLLESNRVAWKAYYDESYVRLPDDDLQRLADMAAYHLRVNATRWSFPVGIFDSHWQGLYFGFDAMYMFEGLASAGHLTLSRREPDFRFSTLETALQRNRHYSTPGRYGARWYWESAEEMPGACIAEGTVPGFWCDHIFHISSIARCAWLQYLYSDDLDYLKNEGYPLMLECARYFRNNWVYEVGDGEAVIGKCTDLERLGPARDRPFLTTCGAIYAMRIAAKAAALLKLDAEEAADFVTCAARLEKGLPQRDGRFTGYLGCREETVGQLGGFYPYPIFPFDHPAQRKAAEAFMTGGAASGNMYPTGRRICPWYAAKMAATLNEMHEGAAAVAWLRTAAESRGLFGEYWEIREPGQYFHPWFTTAAGSTLFALNGILVADSGDETHLACGVPKEWTDYAFRLPTRRGVTVEMVVKGGRLEKLELTPRTPGKSHPMTVVLPEGLRKPSRFTVDVR